MLHSRGEGNANSKKADPNARQRLQDLLKSSSQHKILLADQVMASLGLLLVDTRFEWGIAELANKQTS